MKKTSIITLITISAIAVSGLSFAAPTYASCNDTNISGQTIRVGSHGPMVKRVQSAMNILLDATLKVDGIYGKNTARILRGLQNNLNVKVDGIIGKQTYGAIREMLVKKCNGSEEIKTDKKNYSHVVKTFSSASEAESFIKKGLKEQKNNQQYLMRNAIDVMPTIALESAAMDESNEISSKSNSGSNSLSKTNTQEKNVDEGDIIKTDGVYIYTLSNKNIDIVKTDSDGNLKKIKTIKLDNHTRDMYLDGNTLVVFSNVYDKKNIPLAKFDKKIQISTDYTMPYQNISYVRVSFYNVENPSKPTLEKEYDFEGNYTDSRITNGYLYVVSQKHVYNYENGPIMPMFREDGSAKKIAQKTFYFDMPYQNYNFTQVHGINIENPDDIEESTYLLSGGHTMYASENALYLSYTDYINDGLLVNDGDVRITGPSQKTIIHKIDLDRGSSKLSATGSAPGRIVNQFALSEHKGNLRIATTTGNNWNGDESKNNMYVLDGDLDIIGSLTGLAAGERIYSARFMGDMAYLVTFKQVDPLFVIDLKNPRKPKVKGKLKIPGFSNYLHPYDSTTLLGIGRDVDINSDGQITTKGVKIALFDVSNVNKPREIDSLVLGGKSSYSSALNNHKSVLFSKEKNLLVIPFNDYQYEHSSSSFNGTAVINVNKKSGLSLRGKIKQTDNNGKNWQTQIQRNLYIDDVLYSMSQSALQSNDIDSLEKIDTVKLSNSYQFFNDYPIAIDAINL